MNTKIVAINKSAGKQDVFCSFSLSLKLLQNKMLFLNTGCSDSVSARAAHCTHVLNQGAGPSGVVPSATVVKIQFRNLGDHTPPCLWQSRGRDPRGQLGSGQGFPSKQGGCCGTYLPCLGVGVGAGGRCLPPLQTESVRGKNGMLGTSYGYGEFNHALETVVACVG